jgi:uncharacterized membrane-anchored protein
MPTIGRPFPPGKSPGRREGRHCDHDPVDAKETALLRTVVTALFAGFVGGAALAAAPDAADQAATLDKAFAAALHQSIGSPARADIGDQASVRLADDLIFVPAAPAAKLLAVSHQEVPADFVGLLIGSEGMDAPGILRFVPAGFIDANAALAWTADDMLASLNDTVQRDNRDRSDKDLPELEARRWIRPPHYNPETPQLSWAALVLPKSAPRESDGSVTYNAIGFGRNGYLQLTVVASMQKADIIGQMEDGFLDGLSFRPGKAYGDALPTDRRAPDGLAGTMGIETFHKAPVSGGLFGADTVVPLAGGTVATIGAFSLLIYIRRHLRREARRG